MEDVYNKNIIPAQYRGIGAVAYLATFIGTSNYDLKFAIERYDQDISHRYQQEQIGVAKQQLNVAKQQLDVARQQLNMMRTQALILDEVLQNQYYANFLEEQTQDIQLHGNKLLRSIWDKEKYAKKLIEKAIENKYKNVRFSYDLMGYPNEINISVYCSVWEYRQGDRMLQVFARKKKGYSEKSGKNSTDIFKIQVRKSE